MAQRFAAALQGPIGLPLQPRKARGEAHSTIIDTRFLNHMKERLVVITEANQLPENKSTIFELTEILEEERDTQNGIKVKVKSAKLMYSNKIPYLVPSVSPTPAGQSLITALRIQNANIYYEKLTNQMNEVDTTYYKNYILRQKAAKAWAKFETKIHNMVLTATMGVAFAGTVYFVGLPALAYVLESGFLTTTWGSTAITSALEAFLGLNPMQAGALKQALTEIGLTTKELIGPGSGQFTNASELFKHAFNGLNPLSGKIPVDILRAGQQMPIQVGSLVGESNIKIPAYQEAILKVSNILISYAAGPFLGPILSTDPGIVAAMTKNVEEAARESVGLAGLFFPEPGKEITGGVLDKLISGYLETYGFKVDADTMAMLVALSQKTQTITKGFKSVEEFYSTLQITITNVYAMFDTTQYEDTDFMGKYKKNMLSKLKNNSTLRSAVLEQFRIFDEKTSWFELKLKNGSTDSTTGAKPSAAATPSSNRSEKRFQRVGSIVDRDTLPEIPQEGSPARRAYNRLKRRRLEERHTVDKESVPATDSIVPKEALLEFKPKKEEKLDFIDLIQNKLLLFKDSFSPNNCMGYVGGLVYDEASSKLTSGVQTLLPVSWEKSAPPPDDDDKENERAELEKYHKALRDTRIRYIDHGVKGDNLMNLMRKEAIITKPGYQLDGKDFTILEFAWRSMSKKIEKLRVEGVMFEVFATWGYTSIMILTNEMMHSATKKTFSSKEVPIDAWGFLMDPIFTFLRNMATASISNNISQTLRNLYESLQSTYQEAFEEYVRKPILQSDYVQNVIRWKEENMNYMGTWIKNRLYLGAYIQGVLMPMIDSVFNIFLNFPINLPLQGMMELQRTIDATFQIREHLTASKWRWLLDNVSQKNFIGVSNSFATSIAGAIHDNSSPNGRIWDWSGKWLEAAMGSAILDAQNANNNVNIVWNEGPRVTLPPTPPAVTTPAGTTPAGTTPSSDSSDKPESKSAFSKFGNVLYSIGGTVKKASDITGLTYVAGKGKEYLVDPATNTLYTYVVDPVTNTIQTTIVDPAKAAVDDATRWALTEGLQMAADSVYFNGGSAISGKIYRVARIEIKLPGGFVRTLSKLESESYISQYKTDEFATLYVEDMLKNQENFDLANCNKDSLHARAIKYGTDERFVDFSKNAQKICNGIKQSFNDLKTGIHVETNEDATEIKKRVSRPWSELSLQEKTQRVFDFRLKEINSLNARFISTKPPALPFEYVKIGTKNYRIKVVDRDMSLNPSDLKFYGLDYEEVQGISAPLGVEAKTGTAANPRVFATPDSLLYALLEPVVSFRIKPAAKRLQGEFTLETTMSGSGLGSAFFSSYVGITDLQQRNQALTALLKFAGAVSDLEPDQQLAKDLYASLEKNPNQVINLNGYTLAGLAKNKKSNLIYGKIANLSKSDPERGTRLKSLMDKLLLGDPRLLSQSDFVIDDLVYEDYLEYKRQLDNENKYLNSFLMNLPIDLQNTLGFNKFKKLNQYENDLTSLLDVYKSTVASLPGDDDDDDPDKKVNRQDLVSLEATLARLTSLENLHLLNPEQSAELSHYKVLVGNLLQNPTLSQTKSLKQSINSQIKNIETAIRTIKSLRKDTSNTSLNIMDITVNVYNILGQRDAILNTSSYLLDGFTKRSASASEFSTAMSWAQENYFKIISSRSVQKIEEINDRLDTYESTLDERWEDSALASRKSANSDTEYDQKIDNLRATRKTITFEPRKPGETYRNFLDRIDSILNSIDMYESSSRQAFIAAGIYIDGIEGGKKGATNLLKSTKFLEGLNMIPISEIPFTIPQYLVDANPLLNNYYQETSDIDEQSRDYNSKLTKIQTLYTDIASGLELIEGDAEIPAELQAKIQLYTQLVEGIRIGLPRSVDMFIRGRDIKIRRTDRELTQLLISEAEGFLAQLPTDVEIAAMNQQLIQVKQLIAAKILLKTKDDDAELITLREMETNLIDILDDSEFLQSDITMRIQALKEGNLTKIVSNRDLQPRVAALRSKLTVLSGTNKSNERLIEVYSRDILRYLITMYSIVEESLANIKDEQARRISDTLAASLAESSPAAPPSSSGTPPPSGTPKTSTQIIDEKIQEYELLDQTPEVRAAIGNLQRFRELGTSVLGGATPAILRLDIDSIRASLTGDVSPDVLHANIMGLGDILNQIAFFDTSSIDALVSDPNSILYSSINTLTSAEQSAAQQALLGIAELNTDLGSVSGAIGTIVSNLADSIGSKSGYLVTAASVWDRTDVVNTFGEEFADSIVSLKSHTDAVGSLRNRIDAIALLPTGARQAAIDAIKSDIAVVKWNVNITNTKTQQNADAKRTSRAQHTIDDDLAEIEEEYATAQVKVQAALQGARDAKRAAALAPTAANKKLAADAETASSEAVRLENILSDKLVEVRSIQTAAKSSTNSAGVDSMLSDVKRIKDTIELIVSTINIEVNSVGSKASAAEQAAAPNIAALRQSLNDINDRIGDAEEELAYLENPANTLSNTPIVDGQKQPTRDELIQAKKDSITELKRARQIYSKALGLIDNNEEFDTDDLSFFNAFHSQLEDSILVKEDREDVRTVIDERLAEIQSETTPLKNEYDKLVAKQKRAQETDWLGKYLDTFSAVELARLGELSRELSTLNQELALLSGLKNKLSDSEAELNENDISIAHEILKRTRDAKKKMVGEADVYRLTFNSIAPYVRRFAITHARKDAVLGEYNVLDLSFLKPNAIGNISKEDAEKGLEIELAIDAYLEEMYGKYDARKDGAWRDGKITAKKSTLDAIRISLRDCISKGTGSCTFKDPNAKDTKLNNPVLGFDLFKTKFTNPHSEFKLAAKYITDRIFEKNKFIPLTEGGGIIGETTTESFQDRLFKFIGVKKEQGASAFQSIIYNFCDFVEGTANSAASALYDFGVEHIYTAVLGVGSLLVTLHTALTASYAAAAINAGVGLSGASLSPLFAAGHVGAIVGAAAVSGYLAYLGTVTLLEAFDVSPFVSGVAGIAVGAVVSGFVLYIGAAAVGVAVSPGLLVGAVVGTVAIGASAALYLVATAASAVKDTTKTEEEKAGSTNPEDVRKRMRNKGAVRALKLAWNLVNNQGGKNRELGDPQALQDAYLNSEELIIDMLKNDNTLRDKLPANIRDIIDDNLAQEPGPDGITGENWYSGLTQDQVNKVLRVLLPSQKIEKPVAQGNPTSGGGDQSGGALIDVYSEDVAYAMAKNLLFNTFFYTYISTFPLLINGIMTREQHQNETFTRFMNQLMSLLATCASLSRKIKAGLIADNQLIIIKTTIIMMPFDLFDYAEDEESRTNVFLLPRVLFDPEKKNRYILNSSTLPELAENVYVKENAYGSLPTLLTKPTSEDELRATLREKAAMKKRLEEIAEAEKAEKLRIQEEERAAREMQRIQALEAELEEKRRRDEDERKIKEKETERKKHVLEVAIQGENKYIDLYIQMLFLNEVFSIFLKVSKLKNYKVNLVEAYQLYAEEYTKRAMKYLTEAKIITDAADVAVSGNRYPSRRIRRREEYINYYSNKIKSTKEKWYNKIWADINLALDGAYTVLYWNDPNPSIDAAILNATNEISISFLESVELNDINPESIFYTIENKYINEIENLDRVLTTMKNDIGSIILQKQTEKLLIKTQIEELTTKLDGISSQNIKTKLRELKQRVDSLKLLENSKINTYVNAEFESILRTTIYEICSKFFDEKRCNTKRQQMDDADAHLEISKAEMNNSMDLTDETLKELFVFSSKPAEYIYNYIASGGDRYAEKKSKLKLAAARIAAFSEESDWIQNLKNDMREEFKKQIGFFGISDPNPGLNKIINDSIIKLQDSMIQPIDVRG